VVEPGGSEIVSQLLAQPLLLPEYEPGEDGATLSREPGCDGGHEPPANPVGRAGEPATTTDDAPLAPARDNVHASTAQEGPLVEAVARPTRLAELDWGLDECTLRRRAAERKLEEHRLSDRLRTERADSGRDAEPVRRPAGGAGDLEDAAPGLSDPRREHTPIECVEAHAPPPQAGSAERAGENADTHVAVEDSHGRRRSGKRNTQDNR
jgi:hypothetical protein